MDDDELHLTGRCMCEAVRFEITQPLVGSLYCHCTRCQRRSGGAASITGLAAPGSFAITAGAEHVRTWDPGDGWIKAFCSICASHTHTTSPGDEALVAIRMPLLDQAEPGVRPTARQFVDYALAWEPIPDDGLPRFGERIGIGPTRDA